MNIDKNINKKVESKIESSKIDDLFFDVIKIIPDSKEKIEEIKSEFDLSKTNKNPETAIEILEKLKKYLIEQKTSETLSNKEKKKLGKIIYKDLSFLEKNNEKTQIPKEIRVLFLSIFFALASISSISPENRTVSVDKIFVNGDGSVKYYYKTNYTYDENDNLLFLEEDHYNKDGIIQYYYETNYTYDEIGNISIEEKNKYDKDGNLIGQIHFSSYKNGNKIFERLNCYNQNNILDYYNEYNYEYNTNNNLISKKHKFSNEKGYIITTTYDNKNAKISEKESCYNADGSLNCFYEYNYTYDESGDLLFVERKQYNGNNDLKFTTVYDGNEKTISEIQNYYNEDGILTGYNKINYTHNENGNLLLEEEKHCNEDGSLESCKKTNYAYDENGNLSFEEENYYDKDNNLESYCKTNYTYDEDNILRFKISKTGNKEENKEKTEIIVGSIENIPYLLEEYDSNKDLQETLTKDDTNLVVYLLGSIELDDAYYQGVIDYINSIIKIIQHKNYDKIKNGFSDIFSNFAYSLSDYAKKYNTQERKDLYKLLNEIVPSTNMSHEEAGEYYAKQILLVMDENNISFKNIGEYLEKIPHFKNDRDTKIEFLKFFDNMAYRNYDSENMILGGLVNMSSGGVNLDFSKVDFSRSLESLETLNSTKTEDVFLNLYSNFKNNETNQKGVCSHIAIFTSMLAESVGFKSFIISNNTHLLSVIQDEGFLSLITHGKNSKPVFEKITLQELINLTNNFTGNINLYETFFSDLDGSIVLKKTGEDSGSLINEIVGQYPIDRFIEKGLTIDPEFSQELLEHTENKVLNIDENSKLTYFKLTEEEDLLKELDAVGYTRLFKLSDIQQSGFGASFLMSTFIYNCKILGSEEKERNISNITLNLTEKLEKTIFTKEDIFNILNVNFTLGFLGNIQTQLPMNEKSGFMIKPLNFSFGELGNFGVDIIPSSDFKILIDYNILFKSSFINKVNSIKPSDVYNNIINQGSVTLDTHSLNMNLAFSSELHKACNFNEILFNFMVKKGVLEGLDIGYKINLERLTDYGKELMSMIQESVYKDELSLKKDIGNSKLIITIKDLINHGNTSFSIVLNRSL